MKYSAEDRESMYGVDNDYIVVDEDGREYGSYRMESQAESRIEELYEYFTKDEATFSIVMA